MFHLLSAATSFVLFVLAFFFFAASSLNLLKYNPSTVRAEMLLPYSFDLRSKMSVYHGIVMKLPTEPDIYLS